MKKSNKILIAALGSTAVLCIGGLSWFYSSSLANDITYTSDNDSNIQTIDTGEIVSAETVTVENYEFNISEVEDVLYYASGDNGISKIALNNKYGNFVIELKDSKIRKYKFNDEDSSEKYLIKGTADFSKVDIDFDGYFLVDNTLSGYKKGQITLYKGKLNLPNGDKFNGTLSLGKYYANGTYTWKNGQSYKGSFTNTNKLGSTVLGENKTSEYGYFYFDKSKENYLFIRFVNNVPRESGYYVYNGFKYVVKFDKNGNCTYTKFKDVA